MAAVFASVLSLALALQSAPAATVPSTWLGTWTMIPERSTFDANAPVKAAGQTLGISANGAALHIAGDTVLQDGRHVRDTVDLNLSGAPQTVGDGIVASFMRIDDRSFDIVVRMSAAAPGAGVGTNRFSFSADGRVLTETKTQTLAGTTTTSVLVFERK